MIQVLLPVRAEVTNIGAPGFERGQRVLVDTNVWIWITRGHQTSGEYRAPAYSKCVKEAITGGVQLLHTDHSILELVHRFERDEVEIAIQHGVIQPGREAIKVYRATPGTRSKLAEIVKDAVTQIRSMSTAVAAELDVDRVLEVFGGSVADPADCALALTAMREDTPILTDDADLVTIAGLRVITANPRAIKEARRAHRLK